MTLEFNSLDFTAHPRPDIYLRQVDVSGVHSKFIGHVESLLMDRATFETHRNFWGREDRPQRADLPRLSLEESDLYNDLRDNCLGECLRLEQEHLGFAWVRNRLDSLA